MAKYIQQDALINMFMIAREDFLEDKENLTFGEKVVRAVIDEMIKVIKFADGPTVIEVDEDKLVVIERCRNESD